MRSVLLSAICLACLAAPAATQDDVRAKYMALQREVSAAFAEKDYETAAAKCREMIELAPSQQGPHYNLACALARTGRTDEALASLRKAVDLGYGDAAHMRTDPDLESLREEKAFAEIADAAEKAAKEALEKLYEPGAEIEGVATHEGNPEGGLRWRLRIAKDAGKGKVQRLIVWLHPSGGSMNRVVEALSPKLAERGFALLVPTAKPWMGWRGEEAEKLLGKTLDDVAKIEGVDVKKPVLMGFSAGGQMALSLWAQDPTRFGGLMLDAAYPIDPVAYRKREIKAIDLPEGDGAKSVPIFALIGDQDGGVRIWRQVEKPWKEAGVPLTVVYVEGGRHAWLLHGEHETAFLDWLGKLAPKKAPAESGD